MNNQLLVRKSKKLRFRCNFCNLKSSIITPTAKLLNLLRERGFKWLPKKENTEVFICKNPLCHNRSNFSADAWWKYKKQKLKGR